MNKKFFLGMRTFATVLLVIGIIASILVFALTAFVQIVKTSEYSFYDRTEIQFQVTGLVYAVICLLGTLAGYYVIKGIALIGIRTFDDEEMPEEIDESLYNSKNSELFITPEKNGEKEENAEKPQDEAL